MSSLWVSDSTIRRWHLKRPCPVFQVKYDSVQQQLLNISCADDLLSGEPYYLCIVLCNRVSIRTKTKHAIMKLSPYRQAM